MEIHVKQKLTGNKTLGITEKLGWSSRKLPKYNPSGSSALSKETVSSQSAKEIRAFQAEFECRKAQGLMGVRRVCNQLIR